MSGANVTIRGLDVSTFVTVGVAGRLLGCRVAGTDSNIFLCEHREDCSSVTKEKYTAFFSLDFFGMYPHLDYMYHSEELASKSPPACWAEIRTLPCGR
jgi:hypothetical protein